MKTTLKCIHPGCTWTVTKGGAEKANQALAMHTTMKHGRGVAILKAQGERRKQAARNQLTPQQRQAKRDYQRKWAKAHRAREQEPSAPGGTNYCPQCGCNLQAVNAAIRIMGGGQ